MEPSRRRRPPERRRTAPAAPPPPRRRPRGPSRTGGFGPFRLITAGGALVVLVVIAVALATGTADDLPWGAIVGVAVILGAMALSSRRRERRMREAFPDDEDADA